MPMGGHWIGAVMVVSLIGCAPSVDNSQREADSNAAAERRQKLAETQARQAAARARQDQIRSANEAASQRQIDEARAEFFRQYPNYPFAYKVDTWSWGGGALYIVGTVTNLSESRIKFARIEFDALDSNDYKLGTASDSISGLSPGETWKFSAEWHSYGNGQQASKYRFGSLDGF